LSLHDALPSSPGLWQVAEILGSGCWGGIDYLVAKDAVEDLTDGKRSGWVIIGDLTVREVFKGRFRRACRCRTLCLHHAMQSFVHALCQGRVVVPGIEHELS